eukprot:GEMP01006499.1.p1 GENE.GEMP01006499.1~~GEMP01006499.1.p1  ORF type:complete len:742 (+),score=124.80 GEMP01006499.1:172-2397(+)
MICINSLVDSESAGHVEYVTTLYQGGFNWQVRRRYTDFYQTYVALSQSRHPGGAALPTFPKREVFMQKVASTLSGASKQAFRRDRCHQLRGFFTEILLDDFWRSRAEVQQVFAIDFVPILAPPSSVRIRPSGLGPGMVECLMVLDGQSSAASHIVIRAYREDNSRLQPVSSVMELKNDGTVYQRMMRLKPGSCYNFFITTELRPVGLASDPVSLTVQVPESTPQWWALPSTLANRADMEFFCEGDFALLPSALVNRVYLSDREWWWLKTVEPASRPSVVSSIFADYEPHVALHLQIAPYSGRTAEAFDELVDLPHRDLSIVSVDSPVHDSMLEEQSLTPETVQHKAGGTLHDQLADRSISRASIAKLRNVSSEQLDEPPSEHVNSEERSVTFGDTPLTDVSARPISGVLENKVGTTMDQRHEGAYSQSTAQQGVNVIGGDFAADSSPHQQQQIADDVSYVVQFPKHSPVPQELVIYEESDEEAGSVVPYTPSRGSACESVFLDDDYVGNEYGVTWVKRISMRKRTLDLVGVKHGNVAADYVTRLNQSILQNVTNHPVRFESDGPEKVTGVLTIPDRTASVRVAGCDMDILRCETRQEQQLEDERRVSRWLFQLTGNHNCRKYRLARSLLTGEALLEVIHNLGLALQLEMDIPKPHKIATEPAPESQLGITIVNPFAMAHAVGNISQFLHAARFTFRVDAVELFTPSDLLGSLKGSGNIPSVIKCLYALSRRLPKEFDGPQL